MTQTQKVIKYFAIGLAIFLIVSIISGIISCSYAIFSGLGLINNTVENMEIISDEEIKVLSLEIDLAYTNLYIKVGDKFEVQTNNKEITFKNDSGNVKIKEKQFFGFKSNKSDLIIYIPENMTLFDEVNIDAGAGKINIEALNTQKMDFDLGAGEVYIKNITVTDNIDIDGGVGKTELVNCNFNNLSADLGVGEFKFIGLLTGKNKINSGVGSVNINLIANKENYTVNVSKGLGNIILNGEKIKSDKAYGNGSNYLDIDGGIGKIEIKFN